MSSITNSANKIVNNLEFKVKREQNMVNLIYSSVLNGNMLTGRFSQIIEADFRLPISCGTFISRNTSKIAVV
jgi:hypothetical protein